MSRLLVVLFFLLINPLHAEESRGSGTISKVNLEERTIVINEVPYKINDKTKFISEKLNFDPDRLQPGSLVTFTLQNNLITRIEVESAIEFNE
ncbi:hypothetical protein [Thiolapillus sp.]|uniref:hypothetical protein n=1 Tax=Thiolapillus sp. TaxID=2017437 RepID=UPI0025F62DCA|nr:hypothetical protein [Thiolapillus sp.]